MGEFGTVREGDRERKLTETSSRNDFRELRHSCISRLSSRRHRTTAHLRQDSFLLEVDSKVVD